MANPSTSSPDQCPTHTPPKKPHTHTPPPLAPTLHRLPTHSLLARAALLQDNVVDDADDGAVVGGRLLDDDVDDLARMDALGQVAARRRPRDAYLAERARGIKKQKALERQRDRKEVQLQQARTNLNEFRPGMFLDFTSADICTHAFTRAYRGARLEVGYHRLQNLIMGLCASGVEHAQHDGLERELGYALEFTRAGGESSSRH